MKYYTHSGLFHCDEVTGYSICLLAGACESFKRLTDITNLPDAGIIADIGREYNSSKNRFDHHQGFLKRNNGYPFASAGLLWQKFGEDAVSRVIHNCIDTAYVAELIDRDFIQGIDAHDSDNEYSVKATCGAGNVKIITLPIVVSMFNNEDVHDHEAQNAAFDIAAKLMCNIITSAIIKANDNLLAVREFSIIAKISGQICVLSRPLRWQEIVHEKYPNLAFVISPSMHPGNPYSMTAVATEPDSRTVKYPIERPDWFDGFIHQGQWIAGADSVETLQRLAEFNLNL